MKVRGRRLASKQHSEWQTMRTTMILTVWELIRQQVAREAKTRFSQTRTQGSSSIPTSLASRAR